MRLLGGREASSAYVSLKGVREVARGVSRHQVQILEGWRWPSGCGDKVRADGVVICGCCLREAPPVSQSGQV